MTLYADATAVKVLVSKMLLVGSRVQYYFICVYVIEMKNMPAACLDIMARSSRVPVLSLAPGVARSRLGS